MARHDAQWPHSITGIPLGLQPMGSPYAMPGSSHQPQAALKYTHLENIQRDPEALEAPFRIKFSVQQQSIPCAVEGLKRAPFADGAGTAVKDLKLRQNDGEPESVGFSAKGSILPVQEILGGPGTDSVPGLAE